MRYTKQEAIDRLREELPKGSTVYSVLRHCTRTGAATYQIVTFDPEHGTPWYHGYNVATAIGRTYNKNHEGITMRGYGYAKSAEIVRELGYALYKNEKAFIHQSI